MKTKILFVIMLFSVCLWAQNSNIPPDNATDRGIRNMGFDYSKQFERMGIIVDSTRPPIISVTDSLVSQDTIEFNFAYLYANGYVSVYDSSTSADTVSVEQYSLLSDSWTKYGIGLKKVNTDTLEVDNDKLIIPAGNIVQWEINELRPEKVRIRTLSARSRVLFVEFKGCNP